MLPERKTSSVKVPVMEGRDELLWGFVSWRKTSVKVPVMEGRDGLLLFWDSLLEENVQEMWPSSAKIPRTFSGDVNKRKGKIRFSSTRGDLTCT